LSQTLQKAGKAKGLASNLKKQQHVQTSQKKVQDTSKCFGGKKFAKRKDIFGWYISEKVNVACG
jgi:hypothetical protein